MGFSMFSQILLCPYSPCAFCPRFLPESYPCWPLVISGHKPDPEGIASCRIFRQFPNCVKFNFYNRLLIPCYSKDCASLIKYLLVQKLVSKVVLRERQFIDGLCKLFLGYLEAVVFFFFLYLIRFKSISDSVATDKEDSWTL